MLQALFGTRDRTQSRVKNIGPAELKSMLANGNGDAPLLVDVRSSQEYAYDGHIAGSRLLPLPAVLQRRDELPHDRPIVCVCRSGNRSQVACEQLTQVGYENVINLAGGMIAWRSAGYAVE